MMEYYSTTSEAIPPAFSWKAVAMELYDLDDADDVTASRAEAAKVFGYALAYGGTRRLAILSAMRIGGPPHAGR